MMMPWVDVRDVAKAHVLALKPEIKSGMYLCSNDNEWFVKYGRTLAELYNDDGYKNPTSEICNCMFKTMALFDN